MGLRLGRGWKLAATAAAALNATSWAQSPGGGPPPAKAVLDPVRLETVERWREVTGELRAIRRSIVASQQQGRVIEIDVDRGDRVTAGQVVARLDDELAKLEVARTEANVTTHDAIISEREATLEKSKRDLKRMQESAALSGASAKELDDKATAVTEWEAKLSQVKADLLSAQSDLRRAQKNLKDMSIVAPFDGVVVRKRTEVGQWLSDGDPVIEIVALEQIDAWLDVPESVISRISFGGAGSEGGPLEVQINVPSLAVGGGAIPAQPDNSAASGANGSQNGSAKPAPPPISVRRGTVSAIVPDADPLSRLFPVRVRLDNKDGALRPGMSITGLVPTGAPEQGLTVHRDAVMHGETGAFVYFSANGTSAIAPVTTLYPAGNRLVVKSDVLKPGMSVVVEGNERMFPGQPLIVQGEQKK